MKDEGETLNWLPAKEVIFSDTKLYRLDDRDRTAVVTVHCGEHELLHVPARPSTLLQTDSSEILEAELLHSDLLPAKYEGGLKVWECTFDLLNFLVKAPPDWKDRSVLDLGCGAGLLGILALKLGATVHFQDYNESVLTSVTIPNVLLNTASKADPLSRCKFFAGDWQSFSETTGTEYDCILSSETIYNADNHRKILHVLQHHLGPDAVAFVAAKTYYFGVGGGLRQFEEALIQDNGFQSSVCWKCSQGMQREIIMVTRRS